MIIITGAAGFIGSYFTGFLNEKGYSDLILVDDFSSLKKEKNTTNKRFISKVDRNNLFEFINKNRQYVQFIFHFGARTDTTEMNISLLDMLNTSYSKKIWESCVEHSIPLVYASSAATYGTGEFGFSDDDETSKKLKPLNPYGDSKQHFDLWTFDQIDKPFFWAGLKFFNVYGPNEYHKSRMASVPFHIFQTLEKKHSINLFKSHRPYIADGDQKRDFIYVKDIAEICYFLMNNRSYSGIYNAGTGIARSFNDLASACFDALQIPQNISYIDTPEDIREKYQYFTQAEMKKLISIGYNKPFTALEDGIADYFGNYLKKGLYY